MKLELFRFAKRKGYTLGLLFDVTDNIGGEKFLCFTLEDEYRTVKIPKETCIPDGLYNIILRNYGGHHNRYSTKFPSIHQGMLQLENVEGFTNILIHIGNTVKDTEGCILVGDGLIQNGVPKATLTSSTQAYKRVYKKIVDGLKRDGEVTILINSFFRGDA